MARNFLFLVPELADFEQIGLYWFVSFAEKGLGENALTPLYDVQALFLAKCWSKALSLISP